MLLLVHSSMTHSYEYKIRYLIVLNKLLIFKAYRVKIMVSLILVSYFDKSFIVGLCQKIQSSYLKTQFMW